MSKKNIIGVPQNEEESDARSSNSKNTKDMLSRKSKKKLFTFKPHPTNRHSSQEPSSVLTSMTNRKNDNVMQSPRLTIKQPENMESLPQFTEKYGQKGSTPQQIYEQMLMILNHKQNEIQTMRVYKQELKFMSTYAPYLQKAKLNIKLLQQKAQLESLIRTQRAILRIQKVNMENQIANLVDYTNMIKQQEEQSEENKDYADMGKQKEIMIDNLNKEIQYLVKQLEDEKKRNMKEVRSIQEQILTYRIAIKQKEDLLRDLKAKICTHYIKLHSRNTSTRPKDRNMSMSVRKFNTENNKIRQIFIGNTQFKNFSSELIEKINEETQLIKIKFWHIIDKNKLIFQCVYDKKSGLLHNCDFQYSNDYLLENEKNCSNPLKIVYTQLSVKYLMSIKFFFRNTLTGIQFRVKTDKGNKHIQIGSCSANLQHELVTMVNRKLLTLGSYWHHKDMIGISVWFVEEKTLKKVESTKRIEEKKALNNNDGELNNQIGINLEYYS